MPLASAPNCRWVMKDPRRRAGPCPDLALPAHMFFRTPYSTIIRWLPCAVVVSALALALSGCGAATAPQAAEAAPPHDAPAQRITTGEREPMPVGNIPGWRQVFTDDFNGRTLDSSKWRLYWGKPGGDPAGWFDPRHVAVSHGMLVISAYRDRRDGGKWATGGLSSSRGLAQTYGKYLVRFRLDPGIGVGHAALLMPANNSWPPEIDFSEDNGSGRTGTLATLHYGKDDTHADASLSERQPDSVAHARGAMDPREAPVHDRRPDLEDDDRQFRAGPADGARPADSNVAMFGNLGPLSRTRAPHGWSGCMSTGSQRMRPRPAPADGRRDRAADAPD